MSVWLLPSLPALGAAAVIILGRRRRAGAAVAVLAAAATAGAALLLALHPESASVAWTWGPGVEARLALEGFGRVLAVLVAAVAAAVLAYAGRAEDGPDLPRLLAWMLLFVAAMELLAAAGGMLTLLVAWELVGVCSWVLIGHRYRDHDSARSARRAFLVTRFGDLGLYLAAAALFAGTGSLDFRALPALQPPLAGVFAAGLLLAAAAKSAQVPFSPWLFSAMAGPTPVSALLHSATMVAAGAYAMIRLAPAVAAPWLPHVTALVGIATVLAGGVVAAAQDDVKKALAASTSSQYGLMFVAVGAGSAAAAGAHLVAHAAFKALLFLGAGMAVHAAGSRRMDRFPPARSLPLAAVLFAVGAVALAAVPPLGAAWSKEEVVAAAFGAGPWLGAAVLASGALTAFYAFRMLLLSYGPGPAAPARRPSRQELAAAGALAAVSLLLGVVWLDRAWSAPARLAAGPLPESRPWELAAGLTLVAGAAGAAGLLLRRGTLLGLGVAPALRRFAAGWLGLPVLAGTLVVAPVAAAARALAGLDDRVVDRGVRAAAAVGRAASRLLALRAERLVDALVEGAASVTRGLARGSGRVDDGGIDGAVEGLGRSTARLGSASRRLQTGMTHDYYTIIAVGALVVVVLVLVLPLLQHLPGR